MKLSDRIQALQPSATRVIAERAADLKSQGIDVISLSTGEPDFVSPEAAFDGAREAMDSGWTHYTATAGVTELRQAVADYYDTRFGLSYQPTDVMVGSGAKPLLFEAFAALVNPGDEVILTSPSWVSYVEQVRFFGGAPVIVDTEETTLDLDVAAIEAAITDRTVAFVLNSPHNPTGKIFSEESVAAICKLAVERNFMIVNDEVYERICFEGQRYRNPLSYAPEAREHVLNINAASKTYAMTGWRIGFAVGPSPLIRKMTSLQGHVTSGASSIAQWAALGAIRNAQQDVDDMIDIYEDRKNAVLALLDRIPKLSYITPQGAFYVFIDVRQSYGGRAGNAVIVDDVSFCEALIEQAHLALVPGSAFLKSGYVRLSFATSLELIETGLERLQRFMQDLQFSPEPN
ncbi:MAG: aminotransferase [Rhizobiaceae bacterium MnEN-MB40S]|nr:MAG: aminotransferase [Rhizobiaceae bacterium MnEN-MB40S]